MTDIFRALRKNWLVVVLAVVIVVLAAKNLTPGLVTGPVTQIGGGLNLDMAKTTSSIARPNFSPAAPVEQANRMVVTNTNLSLKVNDVRKVIDGITASAQKLGGFMVDSSLTVPEEGATGMVSVRIPADKLADGLSAIRALGVKVVSENVVGTDVTAEYVDIEARLATLQKTKQKFEQIMDGAVRVEDLLNIQRELISLQSQIDSWRGQQKYLEQTAKLSLVTVYLATDELALPYAPVQPWRPNVIFRQAVRSLVGSLRSAGSGLIWVAVYAPVWLPILFVAWWLMCRQAK